MNPIKKIFAENFGLVLSDSLKGINVKEYYNLFISSINWSRDKIVDYQVNRLKYILNYTYNNSPFFKKRINDCGFNISSFRYIDDLKNISPLTRNDLQNNLNEILSDKFDINKCSKGSSSGSTGHPVIYYHDKNGTAANKASVLLSKYLGGYKPGDSWINIWGNPTAVNVEWKKWGSRIKKFFLNESRYPAYKLNNKEQFEVLYNLFKEKKPKFVYGYTNAIFLFSKFLENKKESLNYINGVFTTAENLHKYQRESIEKFLGPVYDHYGCSEINGIAVQTTFDKFYSVLDPHVVVEYGEVVDKINNVRKLLITDLHNLVLPFIRYENGDLAVPVDDMSSHKFDLNYSKFISIDGRVSDIISLPGGGNLVVPSFFGSRMLKNVSGIKQYQIQKTRDKIIVNLITDSDFKEESKNVILNTLKEYIPVGIKYDLVFNQEIIYSNNGKFKLFIDNSVN